MSKLPALRYSYVPSALCKNASRDLRLVLSENVTYGLFVFNRNKFSFHLQSFNYLYYGSYLLVIHGYHFHFLSVFSLVYEERTRKRSSVVSSNLSRKVQMRCSYPIKKMSMISSTNSERFSWSTTREWRMPRSNLIKWLKDINVSHSCRYRVENIWNLILDRKAIDHWHRRWWLLIFQFFILGVADSYIKISSNLLQLATIDSSEIDK